MEIIFQMVSVLVTGGAGFVGSHIVDRLVDGGYDVIVLDNLTEQVHEDKPEYLNDNVEYVWGDIRDRETLTELLEQVDIVNHQAAAVGVGQSMYEIEKYTDVNTLGTARLLDIIVNEEIDLKKIVVASSMSIYGEGEYQCESCSELKRPPLRTDEQLDNGEWELQCPDCGSTLDPVPTQESKPLESNSIYAITKKDQEQMCMTIGQAYDIPTVALRYFNIYGSRQSLQNPYTGVCAIFSSRITNDNPPLVFEDGQQTRDFIHVSDIARANAAAIERSEADGHAINIGTGNPQTIEGIAESLIELYGRGDSLEPDITGSYRSGDIRHCYADTSKAEELLDFEPEMAFEDGIRELIEWAQGRDAADQFNQAHSELQEKGLVDST
jgi:dTDP-L-rhamnose 4-epimerase